MVQAAAEAEAATSEAHKEVVEAEVEEAQPSSSKAAVAVRTEPVVAAG